MTEIGQTAEARVMPRVTTEVRAESSASAPTTRLRPATFAS
ncbi:MAG: hypothetical protein ACAH04_03845 [Methylibium sp.]|jgi:hypothetical protein